MTEDRCDEALATLRKEIGILRNRVALSDEDIEHLREIYRMAFVAWYDADSEAHADWGRALNEHIAPLATKLGLKR